MLIEWWKNSIYTLWYFILIILYIFLIISYLDMIYDIRVYKI